MPVESSTFKHIPRRVTTRRLELIAERLDRATHEISCRPTVGCWSGIDQLPLFKWIRSGRDECDED